MHSVYAMITFLIGSGASPAATDNHNVKRSLAKTSPARSKGFGSENPSGKHPRRLSMRKWPMIVAGVLVLALSAGLHTAEAASKQRSAASIECSKQADTQGLHGKARRHFRDKCKMGLKSADVTSRKSARSKKSAASKQSKSATTGQKTR
jgi:hypothetical protein